MRFSSQTTENAGVTKNTCDSERSLFIAEIDFLRDLVQQAPGFVIVLLNRDHRFYLVNNAFMELVGKRELIGRTVAEAMPEIPRQGFIALLDQVWETKEPFRGASVPLLIERPGDEEPVLYYIDFIHQPIKNHNGEVIGIYVQGIDITERINFENRLHILAGESAHRVKNILAMVNSVVTQTLRSSKDVESATRKVAERLRAIAEAQSTLKDDSGKKSDLKVLIENTMSVAMETYGNIKIHGPKVDISEKAALALALTLHELMTNAMKYGALSVPDGKVSLDWIINKEGVIDLTWLERGGPQISPDHKKGFGSTLIERSLSYDVHNHVEIDYAPEGLMCHIQLVPFTLKSHG
ncbi:HWE histidine kinase domain-containing protein [uncultured Bartonella sp.]|uniref:HWE histidine kinase domain-containing protein n=1 Tax=uncultured Bartonella sp. TaxID=104108 RepID=UPI002605D5B3|nr:HWE histidine kinase domain-containing protein [uncultured Bartonella sp.]